MLLVVGCQQSAPPPKSPLKTQLAAKFDAKDTGTIGGRVDWVGDLPAVELIKLPAATPDSPGDQPNPNAPAIDPKTRGVAGALVYLRSVDVERSRPWPYEPVTVAFEKSRLDVKQGSKPVRIAVVRRGDEIACVSRDKRPHVLEGRGASVFSLPLVETDKSTKRRLDEPGAIELTSGSALYWLRGHLWVGDHPYAALTDADGRYELAQVPAGEYEVVCRMPSWRVVRRERNPENGDVERLVFEPAVERTTKAAVRPAADATADFHWRDADVHK